MDLLRGQNHYKVFDIFTTYYCAKIVDIKTGKNFFRSHYKSDEGINSINSFLISEGFDNLTYDSTIKHGDISSIEKAIYEYFKNYDEVKGDEIPYIYSSICEFRGPIDFQSDIIPEISSLLYLPKRGNIGVFNSAGLLLIREGLKNIKFEGTLHFYSIIESDLKYAFALLAPLVNNIELYWGDFTKNVPIAAYDFIYSLPPWGAKIDGKDSYYIYEEVLRNNLNENGIFFLVLPKSVLISDRFANLRANFKNQYSIGAIIEIPRAFKNTVVESVIFILKKSKVKKDDIFISKINDKVDMKEDLRKVSDSFRDYLKGNNTFSYSPIINIIPTNELLENWNLEQFSKSFREMRNKLMHGQYKLVKLDELCDILVGSLINSNYYSAKGTPYIRIQDIDNNTVNLSKMKRIEDSEIIKKGVKCKEGDILFSVQGTIGKIVIVPKDASNSLISRHLIIIRPKQDIDPYFIMATLNSDFFITQIKNQTTGSFIKYLSPSKIKDLLIPLPPKEKIKNIMKEIRNLNYKSEEINHKISELEKEKKEIEDKLRYFLEEGVNDSSKR
ncbi:MAG: EcoKI restriction-modification system protein HsdS [Firmicutes bacterium ADurb.Bin080]|nr:MAG: EcoKI restriction-modification system protein HsdS [Firmicutes bacterium ADurb.Bin080]